MTNRRAARYGGTTFFAALLLVAALGGVARAEDQALVRVVAEEADVRTGPGFGFRPVYRAKLGEVLTAIGRATHDHWFRVELQDGTYGWVLGDEVFPLDVDTAAAHEGPSIWRRMAHAVFSPPPFTEETVSFTFSAGILGGDGMFLFRPAVLLAPHVSVEGFVGETVGDQVDVIYAGGGFNAFLFPDSPVTPFAAVGAGGGFNAYLFPTSPVTPFVAGAAGGAFGRKKADQYTVQTGNFAMVNVGGGLVAALKKRLTIRGDVRHYVVFDANHTQQLWEFSGALAVYF